MFPVSEDNVFSKKTDFGVTAAITQQQRLCRILVRAALVVEGRMRLRHYGDDNGGGGEWWRRKS